VQQWGKLVAERAAVEAQLAVLHHRNTTLEEERVVTINHEGGGQRPALTRASQNVATVAMLLITLPALSIDGVDKVYQQPKDILSTATMQQVESSLQSRAEVSILTPDHSKVGWQKATQEPPEVGTASSLARI
jgi:hypothetical protein